MSQLPSVPWDAECAGTCGDFGFPGLDGSPREAAAGLIIDSRTPLNWPNSPPSSIKDTNTRSEGFADSMGVGSLPAVEYATDPASVEEFVNRIKDKNGRIPTYFQVAVGVIFKGGVPVRMHYLLGRELRLERTGVTGQGGD